jgi:hypothetical protein
MNQAAVRYQRQVRLRVLRQDDQRAPHLQVAVNEGGRCRFLRLGSNVYFANRCEAALEKTILSKDVAGSVKIAWNSYSQGEIKK